MSQSDLFIHSKTLKKLDAINERNQFILINVLTFGGAIFLVIFGTNSVIENNYWLASSIFFTATFGLGNVVAYYYHRNYSMAATVLGFIVVALCLYLVISGGRNFTGPLWVFPLIAVAIIINRFKQGLLFTVGFLFVCCYLLITAEGGLVNNMYTFDSSIRFTVSLLILSAFCITLGYLKEKTLNTLKSLQLTLEHSANIDPLTQLYNRHFIIENFLNGNYFNEELCHESSVLLIDIDNFKSINDKYGHQAGDVALQNIAKQLKKGVRSGDIICRWGGEEFLIILANAPLEVAHKRADQFRKIIESSTFAYNEIHYQLTVSIGVSQIEKSTSAISILNNADQKLYQAKHSGKNQVCWS